MHKNEVSSEESMAIGVFKHKTLEERAEEYGGELCLDGEFDWGEPVGREVWRVNGRC